MLSLSQELQSQLDALDAAGCAKVFSEKISTRVKKRPQFIAARTYAEELKAIMPKAQILFTVHEMKRLGRGAGELIAIADALRSKDIDLEFLTGPLAGVHDPRGHGAVLFAFFAAMAESEREYIREKTIEGQATARRAGKVGGRPSTIDADMAEYARSLYEKGMAVGDIRLKLVIPSRKRKGQHPSRASVYRALGLKDATTATGGSA
ncbi:recombinase family protein [Glycomyces arizonensis]|uniref:recombinase family protein n=1 Tax=Glycomyces arizonensis TaxID=256035 RepID=UPI0004291BF3|nr:recombinase family protein [Glycomyces arizonensis]